MKTVLFRVLMGFVLLNMLGSMVAAQNASSSATDTGAKSIMCSIGAIIKEWVPYIVVLMVIGVGVAWVISGEDETKRAELKNRLVQILIGIVIILVATKLVAVFFPNTDLSCLSII